MAKKVRANISEPLREGIRSLIEILREDSQMKNLQEWGFENSLDMDENGNFSMDSLKVPDLQAIYNDLEKMVYGEDSTFLGYVDDDPQASVKAAYGDNESEVRKLFEYAVDNFGAQIENSILPNYAEEIGGAVVDEEEMAAVFIGVVDKAANKLGYFDNENKIKAAHRLADYYEAALEVMIDNARVKVQPKNSEEETSAIRDLTLFANISVSANERDGGNALLIRKIWSNPALRKQAMVQMDDSKNREQDERGNLHIYVDEGENNIEIECYLSYIDDDGNKQIPDIKTPTAGFPNTMPDRVSPAGWLQLSNDIWTSLNSEDIARALSGERFRKRVRTKFGEITVRVVLRGKPLRTENRTVTAGFTKATKQGYDIVKTYVDKTRARNKEIIIGHRPRRNDYFVGVGYDPTIGEWNQGYYDFSTEDEAREFIAERYESARLVDKPVQSKSVGAGIKETHKNTNAEKSVVAAAERLIKVRISGAGDAALNGEYVTSDTKEYIEKVQNSGRGIIRMNKLLRNGEISKTTTYFPFRSYHNNKEIARAYEEKNGNAKIEIVGELENKNEGGLEISPDGTATFTLWGTEYKIKPNTSKIQSTIWLDDEGETYRNLNIKNDEQKKDLFISENSQGARIVDLSNNDYVREYEVENWSKWADTDKEKQLVTKVNEHIAKLNKDREERVGKYYDRYKDKIHFSGYWANR